MAVFSHPVHTGAPAYLLHYNEFTSFMQASPIAPEIILYRYPSF
jgi:hypothetical protein